MRKALSILLSALFIITLFNVQSVAQEEESESGASVSLGTDLMSRYVWRGTQFSTGPSIQPCIEFSTGGLAIGTWGAFSYNGFDGAEADLYISYTFVKDMFTVAVTDYFFPDETGTIANNYFEYDGDETGHVFEGSLSFNGTENLPLTFLFAANFYGADAKVIEDNPDSDDFNTAVGNQMSMYMELGYGFEVKDVALNVFAGFTPTKPKSANDDTGYIGESGFYGDDMGFVNIGVTGSKDIEITDKFSIPVQASFITNPMAENVFIVFGFSF
ncbi:MAG: hypothetical protein C0594_03225 [Marinilabiliales bacterium]|nr:MAG: hypothetical protein C0594_03225 [Marinilabiliales bacterium]